MQSLGKVPSARRPPANLPSLKAETSSPSQDQSGTWVGTSEGTNSTQINDKQNDSVAKSPNNNSSSNSNHSAQSNNSANNINSNNSNNHLSASSNQSSATWSSVTHSKLSGERTPPPSYQSLQFQQEFPSLDGSTAPAQIKGSRGGAPIVQSATQLNDHSPLKNVECIQMSSNQRSPNENIIANTNQPDQVLQQVPPQFRNLMPKFMLQGQGGMTTGITTTNQYGLPDYQLMMNYQPRENKPRSQYSYDDFRRGGDREERSYRRGPPTRSNRHDSYSDAEIEFTSKIIFFFSIIMIRFK